ncbi:MAG: isochorismatase family protein [Oribacterium sp.]|nr:isochorismatase family protein [Oribacterium sp.]
MNKNDLILVIDMQKVYLPGNAWACQNISTAEERISSLLDHVLSMREKEEKSAPEVMLTRFIAQADEDTEGVWTTYNEVNRAINEDPVMNEFIPSIAKYVESFPYYDKCRYSSFSNEFVRTAADRAMVHDGRIVLSGVVAECCVLSTFFEGTDLGYRFIYLTDACAGQNTEKEKAVMKAIEGLSPLHVEFMTTREYMEQA